MEFNAGERLRAIRELYGLSQRALARKAGVTNGMISMIETPGHRPDGGMLRQLRALKFRTGEQIRQTGLTC